MKKTYPKHIASVIDSAIAQAGLTDTMNEQRASYLWSEVVGAVINRATIRRYVENGTLHVYITSAPLKNELAFLRDKIIAQLNSLVGTDVIKDIKIH